MIAAILTRMARRRQEPRDGSKRRRWATDERSHICVVPHPLRLCGRRYQHRPTLLCRRNDKCMSKRGRRAIPFARSVCVSCLNHGRRHALAGDLDRRCDQLRVLCEMVKWLADRQPTPAMVVSAQKSLEASQSRAEDSERKKPKKKSKKKSSKARQGCGLSLVHTHPSHYRVRGCGD